MWCNVWLWPSRQSATSCWSPVSSSSCSPSLECNSSRLLNSLLPLPSNSIRVEQSQQFHVFFTVNFFTGYFLLLYRRDENDSWALPVCWNVIPVPFCLYLKICRTWYFRGKFIVFKNGHLDSPEVHDRVWKVNDFNFDNVFFAMLSLYTVMTFEGWPLLVSFSLNLFNSEYKKLRLGPINR